MNIFLFYVLLPALLFNLHVSVVIILLNVLHILTFVIFMQLTWAEPFHKHLHWRNKLFYYHCNCWVGAFRFDYWEYASKSNIGTVFKSLLCSKIYVCVPKKKRKKKEAQAWLFIAC